MTAPMPPNKIIYDYFRLHASRYLDNVPSVGDLAHLAGLAVAALRDADRLGPGIDPDLPLEDLPVDLSALSPENAFALGQMTYGLIAAAEAGGYARAVANLRAPGGRSAATKVMRDDLENLTGRKIALALADHLESVREPDHA